MPRKAIVTIISAASVAAASVVFPASGNAYQLLSEREMDKVTAGYNLTGTWRGSDGGIYYMRQIGNTLYWYGERLDLQPWPNGNFSNVAHGTINNNIVDVTFAGVPKTKDSGNGGLTLQIANDNYISTVSKIGGEFFGGTTGAFTFTR